MEKPSSNRGRIAAASILLAAGGICVPHFSPKNPEQAESTEAAPSPELRTKLPSQIVVPKAPTNGTQVKETQDQTLKKLAACIENAANEKDLEASCTIQADSLECYSIDQDGNRNFVQVTPDSDSDCDEAAVLLSAPSTLAWAGNLYTNLGRAYAALADEGLYYEESNVRDFYINPRFSVHKTVIISATDEYENELKCKFSEGPEGTEEPTLFCLGGPYGFPEESPYSLEEIEKGTGSIFFLNEDN